MIQHKHNAAVEALGEIKKYIPKLSTQFITSTADRSIKTKTMRKI